MLRERVVVLEKEKQASPDTSWREIAEKRFEVQEAKFDMLLENLSRNVDSLSFAFLGVNLNKNES